MKHPNLCRKKTEMCIWVYVSVYKDSSVWGFEELPLYGGFMKPLIGLYTAPSISVGGKIEMCACMSVQS